MKSAPAQPSAVPVAARPIADVELSTDGDFEHRILNIYEGIVFLCVIMWVFGIIPLPMVLVSAVVGAGALGVYLTNRYSGLPEVMDKRIIRAEVRELRSQVDVSAAELRAIQSDLNKLDLSQQADVQYIRQQTLSGYIVNQLGKYRLEDANIRHVGGILRNRLIDAGIETAADIEISKLYAVEGIGDKIASRLLDWRQDLENQIRATASYHFNTMKADQERRALAQYQTERDRLKIAEKTVLKQLSQLQKDLVREQDDLADYHAVNGLEFLRRVILG